MKFAPTLLLLSVLFAHAAQAQVTYPLSEDAFMKAEGARFDASDVNKNGKIDASEAASLSKETVVAMSDITRESCDKSIFNQAPAPISKDGAFPTGLEKANFLVADKMKFFIMDANHDKSLTSEEVTKFDHETLDACEKNPAAK